NKLIRFLDLGLMPLVNRYLSPSDLGKDEPRFPLEILFCENCALSQLSVVVSPEILYSHYDYHYSVSRTFQMHCELMANHLTQRWHLKESNLVVEIASNDGCLLSHFQKLGCQVLGVEPAQNLAQLAISQGLPTLNQFWSVYTAHEVEKNHGKASLVVATNVVAHVD